MALAEAHPADAGGQALKGDAFAGHVEPVVQMLVVGDEFLDALVGLVNVFGIAGECGPAEGTDAAAEERADVGGHKAGKIEGVLQAHFKGHLANVVAVIEGWNARLLEIHMART